MKKPEVKQHTVELHIVESQSERNPDNQHFCNTLKKKLIPIYEDIAPQKFNRFVSCASFNWSCSVGSIQLC